MFLHVSPPASYAAEKMQYRPGTKECDPNIGKPVFIRSESIQEFSILTVLRYQQQKLKEIKEAQMLHERY
jgi:hypothetical protein